MPARERARASNQLLKNQLDNIWTRACLSLQLKHRQADINSIDEKPFYIPSLASISLESVAWLGKYLDSDEQQVKLTAATPAGQLDRYRSA